MSLTQLQMIVRDRLNERMTEDELLTAITEAATLLGWRWHHIRRSDRAVQMGHQGFPDLVMVKGDRLLFLELKSMRGAPTVDQQKWLDALTEPDADGFAVSAAVARPSMLDSLLEFLQQK